MTKNISDTIKELIELKKDSGKCTEKIVAAHIGTTEKRFRNCLSGGTEFKASEIVELAEFFGVSTDRLLTGHEEKNMVVSKELGLSDSSISYLKDIKSQEYDYQQSFVETAKEMSTSMKEVNSSPDKPIVEGGSSDEVLFMVNWLLSNQSGHNLLSMLAKYCLTDSSQCFRYDSIADESLPFEECDEIYFKNRVGEGWTMFNPGVLRYALIPAINDTINSIRNEISKGGK